MSNNNSEHKVSKNITNKVFLILTSVQTGLMGILFIIQVLRIYIGNEGTFTREICKDYINQILPAIIIWVLLITISFVNSYIKDTNKGSKKEKISKISNITKLHNLENICPSYNSNLDSEYKFLKEYKYLEKEKKNRKIGFIITTVIIVICSLLSLGYLVNPNHFDSTGDVTKQIGSMSIYLLPWVIISFGALTCYSVYEEISAKKSIEVIKTIIKTNGKVKNEKKIKKSNKLVFQIAILVIALGLIVIGLINDGDSSVLQKAITICNECIGLG